VAGAGAAPSGSGAVVDQTIDMSDIRRFLTAVKAMARHARKQREGNSQELSSVHRRAATQLKT
jgi:hypothetical protein